jgi:hypothetical protein
MIGLAVIAVGVYLLWAANPPLGWVVGILAAWYLISCAVKPRWDCPLCGGRKHEGRAKGGRSFRLCTLCGGRGQFARWGGLIWRRNRYLYRVDPRAVRLTGEVGRLGKL